MLATRIRRCLMSVCVLLILASLNAPMGHAETLPLRLSVRRVTGADLLGRVAGTFRLAVEAPEDVRLVTFYMDGRIVGYATRYPFTFQFDTRDFPKGAHQLEAVAHFSNGAVTTSNRLSLDFRSHNWSLAMRQSMFLYAGLVLVLGTLGGLLVHRLLRIRPRLVLLDSSVNRRAGSV